MLDRSLVEEVALALAAEPGLVEKDWHVVRALAVIAGLNHAPAQIAFSGGTSLSKAWGLIERFSEDIDFKVAMPPAASRSAGKKQRHDYRQMILDALTGAGFKLIDKPHVRDEGSFMSVLFDYGAQYAATAAMRPELKIELSLEAPALPTRPRSIQSFVGKAQGIDAEVSGILCVDPVETGADKLSALAWRVVTRKRGAERDDPTIIRHLHDLAALESSLISAERFAELVREAAVADSKRGGGTAPADVAVRFDAMLTALGGDRLWTQEYERYVGRTSFADEGDRIGFEAALQACRRLVTAVGRQ